MFPSSGFPAWNKHRPTIRPRDGKRNNAPDKVVLDPREHAIADTISSQAGAPETRIFGGCYGVKKIDRWLLGELEERKRAET